MSRACTTLVVWSLLLLPRAGHALDQVCVELGGANGCFATLQEAIDASGVQVRIRVGPGSHEADIVIPKGAKRVEILGHESGNTVLVGDSVEVIDGGHKDAPLKLLIADLTIDGEDTASRGISVSTTKLTLQNVIVRRVGIAVFVAHSGQIKMEDSTIEDCEQGLLGDPSIRLKMTRSIVQRIVGGAVQLRNMKIADSTIADSGAGIGFGDKLSLSGSSVSGNALWGVRSSKKTKIHASTISGNGVGLVVVVEHRAKVSDSTIANNVGSESGGGVRLPAVFGETGRLQVRNTIIAGNSAPGAPDCFTEEKPIESIGTTLVGDTTGCSIESRPGDLLDVDPLLGPLSQNGGLTETHSLDGASPAIDAGLRCKARDQRGLKRVKPCDIGAYEFIANS